MNIHSVWTLPHVLIKEVYSNYFNMIYTTTEEAVKWQRLALHFCGI